MTDRRISHEDPEDGDATFMPEPDGHAMQVGPASQADDSTLPDPFTTLTPAESGDRAPRPIRYDALVRGDQVGDFRILRLLGRGSFGAVYLARELSLDRLVAVKVVLPEGQLATAGEGRSLARLKHPNIVGVYGEAHDRPSGCSWMWMQYVDGLNLATVIERLHEGRSCDWVESDLLRLLSPDQNFKRSETRRHPDRGSLETVCRIGRQLGEALAHAHQCGITHRDIKPANILIQRDGIPLLADFNLAENANDDRERVSGGTIAYMPPEQFEQLLGESPGFDARRADIYSLGVVLWELARGCRPHAEAESSVESSGGQRLKDYLRIRKDELPRNVEDVHIGLAMVLWRAMSVAPEKRYSSAKAMATALNGLAELQRARRRAPTVAGLLQFVRRNLVWILLFGGLLPHLAASGLQSFYNHIWIGRIDEAFTKAFIAYNIVVYPACVGWIAWNLYNFARGYRQVVARRPVPRSQLRKLRKRLLRLPRQLMIASAVGWFPGILLFPWLLGIFGPPPSASEWFHYGISFAIAGMIATSYAYAFVLYIVVCHGYRACWQTASHYRQRARYELSGMEQRIRLVSILVGVLPLAAAVLLLAIGVPSLDVQDPKHLSQMQGLHQLVITLIVAGAIGLYVVETAAARLIRVIRALTLADD